MKKKKKKKNPKAHPLNKTPTQIKTENPSFPDCDSYYFYNMGRLMDDEKKVVVEVGGGIDNFLNPFIKGLIDGNKTKITFYRVDESLDGEEKANLFKDRLKTYNVFDAVNIIPFPQFISVANFDDKSIDVMFMNRSSGSSDIYTLLSVWYPKLKDNGWLSGYLFNSLSQEGIISNLEADGLNRFALDFDLGYSIIQRPLTENIFEIYNKEVSSGLKSIGQYLNLGHFNDARQIASRIVLIYPHSPFMANLKAEIDYQCGEAKDSRRLFEKIVDMWPYHVRAMNNLAAIEANTGNITHARKLMENILHIDPSNADAMANLREMERLNSNKT